MAQKNKLTHEQVRRIRNSYFPAKWWANRLGVHISTIYKARNLTHYKGVGNG